MSQLGKELSEGQEILLFLLPSSGLGFASLSLSNSCILRLNCLASVCNLLLSPQPMERPMAEPIMKEIIINKNNGNEPVLQPKK